MDARIIVAKESDVRDLQDAVESLQDALDRVLDETYSAEDLGRAVSNVISSLGQGERDAQYQWTRFVQPRRYRVGRGGVTYADVAWEEMGDGAFTLDEAWEKLEPLMESAEPGADVHRSSLNRALKRDARFAYDKRDGTIYYTKRRADDGG